MKAFALRVPVLLLLLPLALPIVLTPYVKVSPYGTESTVETDAEADENGVRACATIDAEGEVDTSQCIIVRFCLGMVLDEENAQLCPDVAID